VKFYIYILEMPIATRKTKRNHFKNNGLGPVENVGPRVIVPHIIENLLPRNNSPRPNPYLNSNNNSNTSYNSLNPNHNHGRRANYERVRGRVLNGNSSNNNSSNNNSSNGNNERRRNYERVRNRVLKKRMTHKKHKTHRK
jgi:hypothetical protein